MMADLISYTVIVTVHYRLSLLCLRRGGAERVFKRPDENRLRRCRDARRSSQCCSRRHCSCCRRSYWRFLVSRHMNIVRQWRGLMSHVIYGVQCRRGTVWWRWRCVRSHRTRQRTRSRCTACTIRTWLMLLLLLL